MADSTPDTVVYVSNAGSKEVHVLAMNRQSGELSVIDKTAVPGTDKPSPTSMPLAVTPDHRFLYAALHSEPYSVASFAIDRETGRLKPPLGRAIGGQHGLYRDRPDRPVSCSAPPIRARSWRSTRSMRMARSTGRRRRSFRPNPEAHCIVIDRATRIATQTSLGGDIIMQWKFDPATGTLSPNTRLDRDQARQWPRHLAFHPNRRFLYLLTETTARIAGYTIDPDTGTLRDIEIVDTLPADFKEQPAAADLHVTPDGRFLYGSERKSSTLAGFRIDVTTGKLSAIGRFPTEKTPRLQRHRSAGPLSAFGRAGFKRDDGSRDRSANRRAVRC